MTTLDILSVLSGSDKALSTTVVSVKMRISCSKLLTNYTLIFSQSLYLYNYFQNNYKFVFSNQCLGNDAFEVLINVRVETTNFVAQRETSSAFKASRSISSLTVGNLYSIIWCVLVWAVTHDMVA